MARTGNKDNITLNFFITFNFKLKNMLFCQKKTFIDVKNLYETS